MEEFLDNLFELVLKKNVRLKTPTDQIISLTGKLLHAQNQVKTIQRQHMYVVNLRSTEHLTDDLTIYVANQSKEVPVIPNSPRIRSTRMS